MRGETEGETGGTERQTGRRRDIEKQVRQGDTTNKRGKGVDRQGAFNVFCFIYFVCVVSRNLGCVPCMRQDVI